MAIGSAVICLISGRKARCGAISGVLPVRPEGGAYRSVSVYFCSNLFKVKFSTMLAFHKALQTLLFVQN